MHRSAAMKNICLAYMRRAQGGKRHLYIDCNCEAWQCTKAFISTALLISRAAGCRDKSKVVVLLGNLIYAEFAVKILRVWFCECYFLALDSFSPIIARRSP